MALDNKEIQIFNFNDNKVTTIIDDQGEPWFVAKEVCDIFALNNTTNAIRSLKDTEKNSFTICNGNRGTGKRLAINESGLYKLIMKSRKQEAIEFQNWVTEKVLPQIRKTGGYIPIDQEMSDVEILARAMDIKDRTIALRDQQIVELPGLMRFNKPVVKVQKVINSSRVLPLTDEWQEFVSHYTYDIEV